MFWKNIQHTKSLMPMRHLRLDTNIFVCAGSSDPKLFAYANKCLLAMTSVMERWRQCFKAILILQCKLISLTLKMRILVSALLLRKGILLNIDRRRVSPWEKLILLHMTDKCANQTACPPSLISALIFVLHSPQRTIVCLVICKILMF